MALLTQMHYVSHGQKLSSLGGMGHMAGEAILKYRQMSLLFKKLFFIMTLEA